MNQTIDEESFNDSDQISASDSGIETQNAGCLFDINEEIYELLLRSMITSFDENDQIKVEFTNTKTVTAGVPKANLNLQEQPFYTQTIIVNPKKMFKKACLIYLDDVKKGDNDQMSLNFQFINQIRDVNIAKIWIQTSFLRFLTLIKFNFFFSRHLR